MSPELVVVGNLLVDDIVFANGTTRMGEAGGAALHLSLAATLWGTRVGIVSVRGEDYPLPALDALARAGVGLEGVRELDGPGVRTWLLYEDGVRRVVHRLGGPTHERVSPRPGELPAAYRDARLVHLAPMPFAIQGEWVEALADRPEAAISLDPHESVRPDNLEAWRALLARVDVLFASEDELRLGPAGAEPVEAVRELVASLPRGARLRFVAFKLGARGGLLYDARSGGIAEWPPVPRLTGDPTGAGDAFAGGFLAAILAGQGVERAIDQGTIGASFALEDWGAQGLVAATREEAARRMTEWLASR